MSKEKVTLKFVHCPRCTKDYPTKNNKPAVFGFFGAKENRLKEILRKSHYAWLCNYFYYEMDRIRRIIFPRSLV